MIALVRTMNASMTRARRSVQIWSFRNPRVCQKFVRSTTQRAPVWRGSPFDRDSLLLQQISTVNTSSADHSRPFSHFLSRVGCCERSQPPAAPSRDHNS
jgi:hypothetical protein